MRSQVVAAVCVLLAGVFGVAADLCDNDFVTDSDTNRWTFRHASRCSTLRLNCDGPLGLSRAQKLASYFTRGSDNLVILQLHKCAIDPESLSIMIKPIASHPSLSALEFPDCTLTDDGARLLGAFLQKDTNINSLILTNNNISKIGAKEIAKGVHFNTKISSLSLSNNLIGSQGAINLAPAIANCMTLESVALSGCNIGSKGAKALAKAFTKNLKVSRVDLSKNVIGGLGGKAFAKPISKGSSAKMEGLINLNISYNRLGDSGLKGWGRAIGMNSYLYEVDLTSNNISDVGISSIARPLSGALFNKSTSFSQLILAANEHITADGAHALTQAILDHELQITSLDLSHTRIGDSGAAAIAKLFNEHHPEDHKAMYDVSLRNCSIGKTGSASIAQALESNHAAVMVLDLSDNAPASDETISHFAAVIKDKKSKLRSLSLENSGLTDTHANMLATSLINNSHIVVLNLANNVIGHSGASVLMDVLEANDKLIEEVYFQGNSIEGATFERFYKLMGKMHHSGVLMVSDINPNFKTGLLSKKNTGTGHHAHAHTEL